MDKEFFKNCTELLSVEDFREKILKPAADYMGSSCCGVAKMGSLFFDARAIGYNYPTAFFCNLADSKNAFSFVKGEEVSDEEISQGYSIRTTSMLSNDEFHKTPQYTDCYNPNNIVSGLQVVFLKSATEFIGGFGCLRTGDKPFTEEDIKKAAEITPSIYYAYRRYRWISNMYFYNYTDLEESYCGIVQCTEDGEIVFSNNMAREILKSNDFECKVGSLIPEKFSECFDYVSNVAGNEDVAERFHVKQPYCIFGSNMYTLLKTTSQSYNKLPFRGDGYTIILDPEKAPVKHFLTLSRREKEVISMIRRGFQNKEIGFELGISNKTVQHHVERMFKKLSVGNRTEAADLAVKMGFE